MMARKAPEYSVPRRTHQLSSPIATSPTPSGVDSMAS